MKKTAVVDPSAKGSRFDVGKTSVNGMGRAQIGERYISVFSGWKRACKCGVGRKPSVVLDPFGGAGTVSLVAEKLGRSSIYIDLSGKYRRMAKKRFATG